MNYSAANLYKKIKSKLYIEKVSLPFYKNSFYLMLNNVSSSFMGFIFWNVMTRFFNASNVGIGSSIVAASRLLAVLSALGLGTGIIRFIPEHYKREIRLINTALTICGSTVAISTSIYIAGIHLWSPELLFIKSNYWLMMGLFAFTMFNSWSFLVDSSLVAYHAANYVFFKNLIGNVIKIPLTILFLPIINGYGIFAGNGIGFTISICLAYVYFLPSVYKGFFPYPILDKTIVNKLLPYSLTNYISLLFNLAPQFLYPLIILNILGPEISAYFWIAWMVASILTIIPTSISQSLLAEGSHDTSELGSKIIRALIMSLIICIPAAVFLWLFGKSILQFFGDDYAKYGFEVVKYLSFAVIPQCFNAVNLCVNQIKKNKTIIICQTGSISTIALLMGWYLTKNIGMVGMAMAYALAHSIVTVVIIIPLLKTIYNK